MPRPTLIWVVLMISGVWLIGGLLLGLNAQSPADCEGTYSCLRANEWGDFLAGIFAPVAFFWLVAAVYIQSQELSEQRNELRLTRDEMEQQREVMKSQAEEARRQAEFIAEQTEILRSNRENADAEKVYNAAVVYVANRLRQYQNAWEIYPLHSDGTRDLNAVWPFHVSKGDYDGISDSMVVARTAQILRTQMRAFRESNPDHPKFHANYPYDLERLYEAIQEGNATIEALPQSLKIQAKTLELTELLNTLTHIFGSCENVPIPFFFKLVGAGN